MTKRYEIYKCEICGNIIESMHGGAGALVCCGKNMNLFSENTKDAAKEKHVPVIEKTSDGVLVKVGSVAHPMENKHYIEWIEVVTNDDKIYRQYLNPGDKPEAVFPINTTNIKVREYCNLHGLWSTMLD